MVEGARRATGDMPWLGRHVHEVLSSTPHRFRDNDSPDRNCSKWSTTTTAVVDGGGGLGHVPADFAMKLAIK